TKCPDFEILEREIQNGLDSLEMDAYGNADKHKVVKAYRRSAAGNEQPLPSDVRTPESLVSTLDYLVDEVLSQQPLEKCHAFIRDRTRSIRQDFTLQNIRDITAVQVHERIARFHILCLHEMCGLDESKFSEQQETEQLRKVLLSLMEFYDDLREEGIETTNEPEFRAYYMLSHIRDQDIARQAQTLPMHVFKHPYITRALDFFGLVQRNNEIMETSSRRNKPENVEASQNFYSRFFKLIQDSQTTFLMGCMLESHFADVRKGALKAMNVSYMIKAGGVEAEHVRQILAYDSLKQLLNEVHLYGIPLDMSLGEPTIRFGQKHYRTKTPIFVEPLSNPAQVKSLLLVEPKKAGRTFRQIINGDPSSIQPTPPPSSKPTPIPSRPKQPPVTASFTYTDLTGEPPQFANNNSQRQLELKQLEDKAAAAAEAAAAQRKKLDALMQKKKEETEQKKRELERQQQEEAKRRKLEQEQEQQKERLRKEQEERENQLRQERDQQMAAMHRQVVKSQLCNRWLGELMEQAMLENIRARIQRATKTQRFIQHRTRPWLHRVRERIEKRNAKALERHRLWHFHALISSYNPYINAPVNTARPMHSTPEGIRVRVAQSLQAEAFALDNIKEPSHDTQADIWSSENFALFIYPRIQNKIPMMSEKPRWQLLVHVADVTLDSSHWLSCKFGLDGMSRTERYKAFDITIRMVTMDTSLPSQWVDETGAIVFSLPEAARQQSQEQKKHYWETNKQRLTKLTRDLDRYFPGKRVPFLFTYFPDDSCLEDTLAKVSLAIEFVS
ncbi:SAC3 family protein 1, partial [Choanephora cucurbitarum]